MANEIYSSSWWGVGPCNDVGWGIIYKQYTPCGVIPSLLINLQARATYYENVTCTTAILTSLETCP